MSTSPPPAYAWDWFARQRLLWREARQRLAAEHGPTRQRYGLVSAKSDVLARLRADYAADAVVQRAVDEVVRDVAFLGRTDRPFADLGIRNAPRGLRWWWTAITGEELAPPVTATSTTLPRQLEFPDVFGGYGDPG
jgi:hypothetical protein